MADGRRPGDAADYEDELNGVGVEGYEERND
jgi:hypothetical protein